MTGDSTKRPSSAEEEEEEEEDGDESNSDPMIKESSPKRRRRNKPKKRDRIIPNFTFDEKNHKLAQKINLVDIRELVLYILGDGIAPSWLAVTNKSGIHKVVIVMIPGLCDEDFGFKSSNDLIDPIKLSTLDSISSEIGPTFKSIFEYAWPTRSPGDRSRLFSPISTLTQVPLTNVAKKRIANEQKKQQQQSANKCTVDDFVLNLSQLVENGYPIHPQLLQEDDEENSSCPPGWVDTVDAPIDDITPHCYGIDCEMVKIGDLPVLARISIVEFESYQSVLETFVKPNGVITDYLTRYSGITSEILEKVTTNLNDIQNWIKTHIYTHDILIGHSLDSDLNALQIRHTKIIDTSVIYHHPRGPPSKPSLKYLARSFLHYTIQSGNKGHDSKEDAKACLDLVKLKLNRGYDFGHVQITTEHIMARLCRLSIVNNNNKPLPAGTPIKKVNKTNGIECAVIDYNDPGRWNGKWARTCINCTSDEQVKDGIIESVRTSDFVLARLRNMEFINGWTDTSTMVSNSGYDDTRRALQQDLSSSVVVNNKQDKSKPLQEFAKHIQEIYDGLPANTAFIVTTGSGDPRDMSKKRQERSRYLDVKFKQERKDIKKEQEEQQEKIPNWTPYDEEEFYNLVNKARFAVSFFTVKPPPTGK